MKKAQRSTTLSELTPTRYICLSSSPEKVFLTAILLKTPPEKIPKSPTEIKNGFISG